jgi:apolipoprotein N-acyltransferase
MALNVLTVAAFCLLYTLPYLIDRVLAPRVGGLLGSLVFPFALTSVWYVWGVANPWGTTYNPAYTQYGNLPLLQVLSVTGLWGITLLMGWFASIMNWAWERGFALPKVRGGISVFTGLFCLVMLLGGARLALFPPGGSTVRVAGISPSQAVLDAFASQLAPLTPEEGEALIAGKPTLARQEIIRRTSTLLFDDLFANSEQEAQAGAKIILWPEQSGGVIILEEDKPALLARATAFTRATGTYLALGVTVVLEHPVKSSFFTDETILLDPDGNVVWDYEKSHPVRGVEQAYAGEGRVPTIKTPYGRLAAVICYDADFPSLLRQAGQARADILLVPSNDWQEIDPYHTQLTTFRAIENGASLVRQTSRGLAMTVDYQGHVLASADYFTNDPQVMVAYVPLHGVPTLYAVISDLFAWLSLFGLVGLIASAVIRGRQAREVSVAG